MSDMLSLGESVTETPTNDFFKLHSHDNYEIYLFLEGDTKYIVEGKTYSLKPYDIIVIRKSQMHRAYHNTPSRYRRFVINVSPDFFKKYNCTEYEEQFFDVNTGNKIDAEAVLSSGLYDAVMRLIKYSKGCTDTESPIVIATMTEILYLLSNTQGFSYGDTQNSQLSDVIEYINSNYTDNITLEALEKQFFVSKYHLCHLFKKATGLTVHEYITRKRINLVKELVRENNKIGEACNTAGFNSYSSFYRAYIREYSDSPKIGMRHFNALKNKH